MASENVSQEIQHLDNVAMSRYRQKLVYNDQELFDPYSMTTGWSDQVTHWPDVQYGDLYNYLINSPGKYTQESLKAFKSLDAYGFFQCGFVQTVYSHEISSSSQVCFLKTKVTPSQKLGDKPHQPWVMVHKKDAFIVAAHCTCKAGLGEACSHIAALLFKVEACMRNQIKTSATDEACKWNRVGKKQLIPRPIQDLQFSVPSRHKKKRVLTKKKITNIPSLSAEQISSGIEDLKIFAPEAVFFMSLPRSKSDTDTASEDEESSLPEPLTSLHVKNVQQMTADEKRETCISEFKNYMVTEQQCHLLCKMTTEQSNSSLWLKHRAGRITTSMVHQVWTRKPDTPPAVLVNKIIYPSQSALNVPATEYGLRTESKARKAYHEQYTMKHDHLSVDKAGLVIRPDYPHPGASPDGMVNCKCCGDGLLEIKCPYNCRDTGANIHIGEKGFCLDNNGDLIKCHKY